VYDIFLSSYLCHFQDLRFGVLEYLPIYLVYSSLDIAWHPEGDRLLAVYSADGGDNQISIIYLNKSQVPCNG